jgi:hypothetical protein
MMKLDDEVLMVVKYFDKDGAPVQQVRMEKQWNKQNAADEEQNTWGGGVYSDSIESAAVMPLFCIDGTEFALDELKLFCETGDTDLIGKEGKILPNAKIDELRPLIEKYEDEVLTVENLPEA